MYMQTVTQLLNDIYMFRISTVCGLVTIYILRYPTIEPRTIKPMYTLKAVTK